MGKVKLSCGLRGDESLTGGIPAFPVLSCGSFLSVREGCATVLSSLHFFNHCATMQAYTHAQVYEYTSIQYHLFSKYVKLSKRRRSNTVPRSQITMFGGVMLLLITPCKMKNDLFCPFFHYLIVCILTLLCIFFGLPQNDILYIKKEYTTVYTVLN